MKNIVIFGIISLFISNSRACVDYIYDIHISFSNMADAFANMEANLRIQYNTIQIDRLKVLSTMLNSFETIQDPLPRDLCKFQGTEESTSFLQTGQDLVANVRKNLIYSSRAQFEEMRIDQSNIVFGHIAAMADFLEDCFEPAKAYFTDGKACVINLEKSIKNFLDTSASRIVQCMKNNTVSYPLTPSRFKNQIESMTAIYKTQAADMKKPFTFPILIGYWSTKKQNETAAEALLTVRKI